MLAGTVTLRFGDPKRFKSRMEDRARRLHKGKAAYYERKINALLRKLISATPRFTGAASGNPTDIEIPRWHPAYGMIIGNSPGETGWQLKQVNRGSQVVFLIINPMWNLYLKYVEYGTVNITGRHFVSHVWNEFKAKNDL